MVSRHPDLRPLLALLRTLSAGRVCLAVIAVWWVTPLDPASPLVAWTVAVPVSLAAWYGALTALARLRRSVPAGTGTTAAWTAVACGTLWTVALLPLIAWPYAVAASCGLAFAAAGALRHRLA